MGTQLTAKRSGTCPECGNSWRPNDTIFWDGKVKNQHGLSVVCTDPSCFKEQGGTLTASFRSKSTFKPVSKYDRPIRANIPTDVKVDEDTQKAYIKLQEVLVAANKLAHELYPDESDDSQQFGQIRSKLADQLIHLLK